MMKLFITIVMSLLLAMTAFATAEAQNSITITVNGESFVVGANNIEISKDGIAVDGKQLATGDRPLTVVINGNVANLSVTGGDVTATWVTNLSVIEGEATVKEVTERVTAISSTISIEKNSGVITNTATQSGSGNVQYNKF